MSGNRSLNRVSDQSRDREEAVGRQYVTVFLKPGLWVPCGLRDPGGKLVPGFGEFAVINAESWTQFRK